METEKGGRSRLNDIEINVAEAGLLQRALSREANPSDIRSAMDLGEVLRAILSWANRFVPSHSGSILIDDPVAPPGPGGERDMYFLACFGEGSRNIAGKRLADCRGIAGETYKKGCPYISPDVMKDDKFFPDVDAETEFQTRSIICAPIVVEGRIIGVIELLNRIGSVSYEKNDLVLLEIFAGYTGTLIENALSARMFEEISRLDNLTGLYNDRYFFHALRQQIVRALGEGDDISLIFFDLDRLKNVNDTYGHLAGSGVIREVAGVMCDIYSGKDVVMARYGGDEYVIILPGYSLEEAVELAERMRSAIAAFTFLKKPGPHGDSALDISGLITCSVGVASLGRNISPHGAPQQLADNLIRMADRAMYASKENGKNRVTASEECTE